MDSSAVGSTTIIILLHAIIVLQCFWGTSSREINKGCDRNHQMQMQDQEGGRLKFKDRVHHHHHSSSSHPEVDPKFPNAPELQVFFRVDDLKFGKRLPIYFPIKDPSKSPPLLSKEEAESIPFSSAQLPDILKLFSISDESPQAKAMAVSLGHCEFEALKGESKFCATSLESLVDSTRAIFGQNVDFKVATTKLLTKAATTLFQNYTIVKIPKEISAPRIVGCHPLPYPYAVFYCHSQESDNRLFKVSLLGDNGWRVDALGMCHMDTSLWDPHHVAFLMLKTQPGKSPVCHFFPADNLVWFPSAYEFM